MAWQPIETAPTDGTAVDLWVQNEGGGGERYPDMIYQEGGPGESNDWHDRDGMFSVVGDCMRTIEQVTHWMPIPDGPNG